MWPFSTIRKLREQLGFLQADNQALHKAYSMATSISSDVQRQNATQAETIRRLTDELEQARRNDMPRGPHGRFVKRPELVKG